MIRDYIQLTKPRIMLLVVFSGITALFMEKSLLIHPFKFALAIFALYLTGGAANALNNYFERDIDARMARTKEKRPLPQGRIKPLNALIFAILIGTIGVLVYGFAFNWLSAALSLATILFYGLFYTLLLKPNTPQNIVIGGAAGAMAPVGVWAAASGSLNITPWTLFLIIFFWSPPHFWALAVNYKDDYKKANLPMLPVVRGEAETLKQMLYFSIILFLASLTPVLADAGLFYLLAAIISGMILLKKVFVAKKTASTKNIWAVFGYSIIYLFVLLITLIIDSFIPPVI